MKLLSGFPMKSEIEILFPDGTYINDIELKKHFIPENDTSKGRNIVQIIPKFQGGPAQRTSKSDKI